MPILDIRRHAERAKRSDEQSGLSADGRAMCERLAGREPRYARVVSSPLPRAKETAERIAGRLDAVEPGLLPDLGSHAAQLFGDLQTLADWAKLLHEHPDSLKFAEEQLPVWARIASRLGEKDKALAISHGGIIELPAVLLMQRLRIALKGEAFGYGEGVRIIYLKGEPTALEVLRV